MNNENEIIVGLDIGTTKIACFIGARGEGDKIKIIGFGKTESKGVERGVVKNIRDTAASITKAVEVASEQAGIEVKEVYVGIAGQHIKSIQNVGMVVIPAEQKVIEQHDLDRLIEEQHNINLNPGEDIIHIFPQNYVVDGEELSPEVEPVGVAGKQLKANFHIVTGNTMNLLNIHYSVERAGLKIKGVVLEPVASAYAVLDNTDKDAGVALVDIGGGTTDIAIFKEGIIRHTTVLPLAGNAITNDIKDGCKIMRTQAEALKTRFGSCLPQNVNENDIISIPGIRKQAAREISMRTLAGIIKARTETILEQVDYEIKKSHLEKDIFAGIVLTGGGAQLNHIKELTEFITGIDTRIGYPDEHLDKDTDKEIINTMYATGIGLVLYGFDELDKSGVNNMVEDEPEVQDNEPVVDTPENESQNPDATETESHADPIFAPVEIEETPTPTETTTTPSTKPTGAGRRFGSQLTKAIEKYFNKVFNDGTIRNEGNDELDL
ncbi:MAG: cell division protein FtsA [Bacteroidales bacterium]|nr:cell division protein FtsA [Bacteroidales bacterium]